MARRPAAPDKPAAAYIRVSKEREGMEAANIYREQVRRHASAYGHRLQEPFFEDLNYSGRTSDRPAFQEMMRRLDEFSLIIVPKLSRLGRNAREGLETYDRIEAAGVGLAFLDLRIDTTTASGRLMRTFMVALAEYESDLIGERFADTRAYVRRQGRPLGGTNTPYGYRYDPASKTYVEDRRQSRVVKEIFERFLSGDGLRTIEGDLNRRGIAPNSRRGATQWRMKTIKGMLSNPAYAGLTEVDGDLIKAKWDSIITRKTWERSCARLEAMSRTRKAPREGTGSYLLSGLLKCAECGGSMAHHAGRDAPGATRRIGMYECQNGCKGFDISAPRAERIVSESFLEVVSGPFARKALKAPRSIFPKVEEAEDYDGLLREIERGMDRYIELRKDAGPLQAKRIDAAIERLEREAEDIQRQRVSVVADDIEHQRKVTDLEELRRRLSDLPEVWDRISVEDRKAALALCIERIETVQGTRPKELIVTWADWLQVAAVA